MKKLISVAAVAATLVAAPAFAAATISRSSDVNAPAGSTTVLTFEGALPTGVTQTQGGVAQVFTSAGFSYTGGFAFEGPTPKTGNYFGVGGNVDSNGNYTSTGGTASFVQFLNSVASSSISVTVGTIDAYNQVQLLGAGGVVLETFTGTQMFGTAPTDPGSQTSRITFTGTGAQTYSGIRFQNTSSTGRGSFEFDNVAFTAAVPEPSTWAMMVLGFGAVGFAARRRSKTSGAVITA